MDIPPYANRMQTNTSGDVSLHCYRRGWLIRRSSVVVLAFANLPRRRCYLLLLSLLLVLPLRLRFWLPKSFYWHLLL